MGNVTLSMPDDLLKKMKMLNEIKWSEIARRAIEQRISDIESLERIAKKSKLTKKDVEEFSKKIKSSATKRFLNEGNH